MNKDRRKFLKLTSFATASGFVMPIATMASCSAVKKTNILVWDERSEEARKVYGKYLGEQIAAELDKNPNFNVSTAFLDDPEQGLSDKVLDGVDVLIWWGHVRHQEISAEKGRSIVKRIEAGSMSLIALHSAHWASPFVESMNEITRKRVLSEKGLKESDVEFIAPATQFTIPAVDARITPYATTFKYPNGSKKMKVALPICCFPHVRNDGKPSTIKTMNANHPILRGVPAQFEIEHTEMYNEPFHVPEPDQLLFEEYWETGEWFRSGMLWNLGKGKVFYFRPGHESHTVFKQEWPIRIIENAATWFKSGNSN
jgi:trehalose utilization protein